MQRIILIPSFLRHLCVHILRWMNGQKDETREEEEEKKTRKGNRNVQCSRY